MGIDNIIYFITYNTSDVHEKEILEFIELNE